MIFDISALEKEKIELEEELNIVAKKVNGYISENTRKLQNQDFIAEFDKNIWLSMVDYLTVKNDGNIEFTFLDGSKVEIER